MSNYCRHCKELSDYLAASEQRAKEELAELRKEAKSMRQALIGWRQRAWPGTDQTKVIDRDFPIIAAMEKANE